LVFLHRRAFRGIDRFTATGRVPKVKLSSLSQRNYRQNRLSRNNSPATSGNLADIFDRITKSGSPKAILPSPD
jgi:hypothetical protein